MAIVGKFIHEERLYLTGNMTQPLSTMTMAIVGKFIHEERLYLTGNMTQPLSDRFLEPDNIALQ
ncbi:hypothetical protein J6590_044497 [Homalodisca vitripennis]|nr:hypothetical protein J6590_044497 [Homalodisca vitripennis]